MALFATIAIRKMNLTQRQHENQLKQMKISQQLQELSALGTALADGVISPHEIARISGSQMARALGMSDEMLRGAQDHVDANSDELTSRIEELIETGRLTWDKDQSDIQKEVEAGLWKQGIQAQFEKLKEAIAFEETRIKEEQVKTQVEGQTIEAEMQSLDQGLQKGAKELAPKL